MTDAAVTPRVVLVTGGSRGIGLACARALPARSATTSPSRSTARRRPTTCSASSATSPTDRQVDAAFAAVEAEFGGPVEVLVSNAGITRDGLLLRMSEDDFARRRSTPTSPPPTGSPSAPPRACCAPARGASSSCRRSSACAVPPARPTTRRRRRASSGSPGRWPASSARAASPSTSSPRDRSRPT